MYKRVDTDVPEEVIGYSYVNNDGEEEVVEIFDEAVVEITTSGSVGASVYTQDIPNLIKALKAAYYHNTKLAL